MTIRFSELEIGKDILKSIEDMGFEEATPIQTLAIPFILAGRDIVGQAQTGTGKTAAFGIPILEHLELPSKDVQAIILCPTRELAIQVAEELTRLAARKKGVSILPIYGGQPMDRQLKALQRGVNLVVGTPGRVMDHMQRKTLKLGNVRTVVLDEADEMLDMGFREDIELILADTPADCQRVCFSATMAPPIMELARKFLKNPEMVKVTQKMLTVPSIEQHYFEVRPYQKMESLFRVLDAQNAKKVIVFCSTKRGVDELTMHLQTRGYQADGLHGNLSQGQRDRVMNRFRSGGLELLVATDVAARGLDVDDVEIVVNYDIPTDVENYVHRIGRTGRAGRSGMALTFVTAREQYKLRDIIRYTKANIVRGEIPTIKDVATMKVRQLLDEIRAALEEGGLDRYMGILETNFDEGIAPLEISSALLKMLVQRDIGDTTEKEPVRENTRRYEDDGNQRNRKPGKPFREGDRDGGRDSRDGRDNRSRDGKPGRDSYSRSNKGMTRLFFNIGQKMRVEPRDFVGAIAGEADIPGKIIGAIEIHDRFSFVDIPSEYADKVVETMNGSQIRGYKIAVEAATPKS